MWGTGLPRVSERACGGTGAAERLGARALVEVVVGNGLGPGGIELWGLIEVVRGRFLGDLFCFPAAEAHLLRFGVVPEPDG